MDNRRIDCGVAPRIERRNEGEQPVIVGYAGVHYVEGDPSTEFRIFDVFVERMMPGAFDSVIRSDVDVVATFNHNDSNPLGRRSEGTLRLSVDNVGLRYEIDPPDTTWGRDVVTSIERRDVKGSSFEMIQPVDSKRFENKTLIRDVRDVGLLTELGPVLRPAYPGTAAALRSEYTAFLEAHQQEIAAKAELRRRVMERQKAIAAERVAFDKKREAS